MSKQFDDFGNQLREILSSVKELREENKLLKENNLIFNQNLNFLSKRVSLLEQKSITNYVEITGVPENKNDNCKKIIDDIAAKLDEKVSVIKAFRVQSKFQSKSLKIVVELFLFEQKKILMDSAKKKKLRSNLINEN